MTAIRQEPQGLSWTKLQQPGCSEGPRKCCLKAAPCILSGFYLGLASASSELSAVAGPWLQAVL